MFFRFNIREGSEGFHKKVCMYCAGLVIALDIGLSVMNHFTSSDAKAQVQAQSKVRVQTAAASKGKKGLKKLTTEPPIPQVQISSASNPIIHWYEYYFCRGFQSAVGCSQRSMRATTSLDYDPKFAAQNKDRNPPKEKLFRDTYSIDILDRASGNTQLK